MTEPQVAALLDVDGVAEMLGVSAAFVRAAANKGLLRCARLSPQVMRFRVCDVEAYVAATVR